MRVPVTVPALGESITEALIARWEVKAGDAVALDAPLVELETDKVTVVVPSPQAGQVLELLRPVGATVAIGEAILVIDTAGATLPAAGPTQAESAAPAAAPHSAEPSPAPQPGPAARRLLAESGLDPHTIKATAPGGRLAKGDVLQAMHNAASQTPPSPKAPPQAAAAAAPQGGAVAGAGAASVAPQETTTAATPLPLGYAPAPAAEHLTPMSPIRKRIAQRLLQAQANAAILTTFNEVDMSPIMAIRKAHQEAFVAKHGVRLSFMGFFVKAAVAALKAFPAVNAEIRGDDLVYKTDIHIGVAVGGGRGLVVPVIHFADRLSLPTIERIIVDRAEKARNNRLSIEELQHGTFTISNGGVYGSMLSTPILNPPQSGILGLHNITERPVARDGQVLIRPMMYLALSYDHRIIDGREAVTFLVHLKESIEAPERLLLEI